MAMIFVLNCEVLDENLLVENLTSILMDVASIRDLLVYVYHPRATTNGCILSKSTRTSPFQMLEEERTACERAEDEVQRLHTHLAKELKRSKVRTKTSSSQDL